MGMLDPGPLEGGEQKQMRFSTKSAVFSLEWNKWELRFQLSDLKSTKQKEKYSNGETRGKIISSLKGEALSEHSRNLLCE